MSAVANLGMVKELSQAAALLDPLRLQIIENLREPDSASGLARRMHIPRQKMNYHVRELEREGFLEQVSERRKGNCVERMVRATANAYLLDPALLGALGIDPKHVQDHFSSAYLVAVAAKAIRELAVLRSRAEKAGKRLATLTLQTEVRFASAADRNGFAEELAKSLGYLSAKYNHEMTEGGRTFQFFVGGYPALAEAQLEPPSGEKAP
jgi:DNA-binding transcriptional ArsR family regulator